MIRPFAQRRKGRIQIASHHLCLGVSSLSTRTKAVNTHHQYATAAGLRSRLSNTIKIHSRGSLLPSGGRLSGLPICHKFCTQANVQTPPPKDNYEPTRVRLGSHGTADDRDKALIQEAITYAQSLKEVKGEDGFLKEKNNLSIIPKLGFCGNIYIPPKYSASARATTIFEENSNYFHFVFFVDGSLIVRKDPESGSLVTYSGAAVVYKPLEENQPWVERYFAPPKCERGSDRLEVIAILDGLKVAAVETDLFRRCDPGDSDDMAAKLKVAIFSDCTSALQLLLKLQSRTVAKSPLLNDPMIREIIAVSQYLHRKGVDLDVRWVPGHSLIPGNTFANGAAQYAARQPEIGAILEERLRVKVASSPGTTEPLDSQKSCPQNRPQEKDK